MASIHMKRKLSQFAPVLALLVLVGLAGCNLPAPAAYDSQAQAPEQLETIAYMYARMTFDAQQATQGVLATPTLDPEFQVTPTEEPTEELSPESPTETPAPSATDIPTNAPLVPTNPPQPPAATDTPEAPTETTGPDTATPTITQTPTQTPTATSFVDKPKICDYGVGRVYATKFTTAVNVDGNIRYWGSTKYAVPYLVYGGSYSGDWDLDPTYMIGWSEEYLYLAVRVQDDRYVQFVDAAADIYKGDSLEILFDSNLCGDYGDNTMSSDDYQIGISPGYVDVNGPKYVYEWYPGRMRLFNVLVGTDRVIEGQTIYEVGIPWSLLGVAEPRVGSSYGFALSVSDNDDPNDNKQETMLSSVYRAFKPETWSTLILQ